MIKDFKDYILENWDCLLTVVLICIAAAMTTGCAMDAPIGEKYQPSSASGQFFVKDLKAASSNLDQAVRVGALTNEDPAPACLKKALARFGEDQETFIPAIEGAVSLAAVAYIKAKQVENRDPVSSECKSVIGDIIIRRMTPL